MIATHCFILFAVISIISSLNPDRQSRSFNCEVIASPSVTLAERLRTCNFGLSDCRNVPEEARYHVANFIEYTMEKENAIGFFNIHQGDIQQSLSYRQLRKDYGKTTAQAVTALSACVAMRTYNTQQIGLPKLGRVPGQNSITSGALESFYESDEFTKIKKSIGDYFRLSLNDCEKTGLARGRRDMRPDYDASGDFALQRSKRSRTQFTYEFVDACRHEKQSFRTIHCTQGAIIDYGAASFMLSFAESLADKLKRSRCRTSY